MSRSRFLRSEIGQNVYQFCCEACGDEGELALIVGDRLPFDCPAGCGAVYVQWTPLNAVRPALKCVVRPVLQDEARE